VGERRDGPSESTPFTPFDVGRYRVIAPVGHGGMGIVYRAVDTILGRSVALKFISAHRDDDADARRRFMREARAASALDHPHIGCVYEVGEHDGRAYFAMAYYDGETLRQRIARGGMTIDEAERIARQLLDALGAAHAAGILHRDVKPANVMLTIDGSVKLLDFGVAKIVDDSSTQMTVDGAIVGTLAYMAPEQLRGEAVDARADLWAAGAVTYEMLAGVPPFVAPNRAALVTRMLTARPSSVARTCPKTPRRLRLMVDALLEPDRAARPAHAKDALAILDGNLRPRRRLSWRLLAMIAAIAVALIGLTAGWLHWRLSPMLVARQLVEQAGRDFDLRRYDEARREFEDAYRSWGDPTFLYNAALSYRSVGRRDDAIYFFKLFLAKAPDTPNRGEVERKIHELETARP
jgi:serine/threonine protein kinase